MQLYGERNIPLEVNESHHWSLRDAPDVVAVAAAFLAAYNAKKFGVKHYVAQYMFNTPARTSPAMDLAKMLAKIELIEALHDNTFTTIRQTRAGLASLNPDPDIAKGQLSASTFYQLAVEPKIVHVVGFCEGHHAATSNDIIESAKIVDGVIKNHMLGSLSMIDSDIIQTRKKQLIADAQLLLKTILEQADEGVDDPWTDPNNLAKVVKIGLLDAPHLCGNPHAAGQVFTQIKKGACVAVDLQTGLELTEQERIAQIFK